MVNTGLLLPRHGLRHISAVQPKLTFPPRTDFQIVLENLPYSYSVESYQITIQKELAEIRTITAVKPKVDIDPPQFAASRKGQPAVWAKSVSLMPLVSLSSARFQLLCSEEVGGLNLSVEEIVQAALDYELRESRGIRSWSPVIYKHLFDITHCVGDSYIVADPVFEH